MTRGAKAVCNVVEWTCNDKHVIASICLENSKEEEYWINKIKVWTPEGHLKHELNVICNSKIVYNYDVD